MKWLKPFTLFTIGGVLYIGIEVIWRSLRGSSPTHWTMFLLGGIAFLLIGAINEFLPWETPIWEQMLIGTGIILVVEFDFGCVLNLWLGLGIWDYSDMPFNILGQICLPFAIAWFFLSAAAIVLDDYLRYWLFGEEKPRYRWK
jgi:uncharacterized membrane protein